MRNVSGSAEMSPEEWPGSEAAVIEHEAAQAKAALERSLGKLKASLRTATDVRLWTRYHPWLSVSVAAAAGFVLAKGVFSDRVGSGAAAEGASAARQARAAEPRPAEAGGPPRSGLYGLLFSLAKESLAQFASDSLRAAAEARSAADAGHSPMPGDRESAWREAS